MVEMQIEDLRSQLNHLIDRGCELSEVYELSVKLDKLIAQYYIETRNRKV